MPSFPWIFASLAMAILQEFIMSTFPVSVHLVALGAIGVGTLLRILSSPRQEPEA